MQTQWSVIIEILKRIGDVQFQKEVWMEHKYKHPLSSFAETVNTLDDYFFFDSIKTRELPLKEEEYRIIDVYIDNLLSCIEPQNALQMLNDFKWINIMKATQGVIDILESNTHAESNKLRDFYSSKRGHNQKE